MVLIVFDIDGTLTCDNTISDAAFQMTVSQRFGIKEYSHNWADYHVSSDIGIVREICHSATGENLSWKDILSFEEDYLNHLTELFHSGRYDIHFIAGTENLFTFLGKKGCCCAVYSGGFRKAALFKLSLLGITDEKMAVATANDALFKRDIFVSAYNRARLIADIEKFEKVVIVGDSDIDVAVSRQLSVPMIGVRTQFTSGEFKSRGISCSVDTFDDEERFLSYVKMV